MSSRVWKVEKVRFERFCKRLQNLVAEISFHIFLPKVPSILHQVGVALLRRVWFSSFKHLDGYICILQISTKPQCSCASIYVNTNDEMKLHPIPTSMCINVFVEACSSTYTISAMSVFSIFMSIACLLKCVTLFLPAWECQRGCCQFHQYCQHYLSTPETVNKNDDYFRTSCR